MALIAELVDGVIGNMQDDAAIEGFCERARELCRKFPVYQT